MLSLPLLESMIPPMTRFFTAMEQFNRANGPMIGNLLKWAAAIALVTEGFSG